MSDEKLGFPTAEQWGTKSVTTDESYDPLEFDDPNAVEEPTADEPKDEPGEELADEVDVSLDDEPVEDGDEPEGESLSPAIMARARSMGLTDEQLSEFGSDAEAQKAMDLFDQAFLKAASEEIANQEKAKTKQLTDLQSDDPLPEQIAFEIDENDPVGSLGQMAQHYTAHIRRAYQEVLSLRGELQGVQNQLFEQQMDHYLANADGATAELYGTGPTALLDPESEQHRARQELAEHVVMLAHGQQQKNPKAKPRLDMLFERAKHAAHGKKLIDKETKAVEDGINNAARDSQGRWTRKPRTRKGGDMLTPDERATANVAKKMRQWGVA